MRKIFRGLVGIFAAIYLVVDLVFSLIFRPIIRWISRQHFFQTLLHLTDPWPPYVCLLVVLFPLALLEPFKIGGIYLIGTGHTINGLMVLATSEVLKVVFVERIFHHVRSKLLTIAWFAYVYGRAMVVLDYIKGLAAYRYTAALIHTIQHCAKECATKMWARVFSYT